MATPRFTPQELGQLRELARQWAKIVSKRAFGDDGPGLDIDFRTMEQIATAAHGLTEGTLELLLRQQADKLPDEQPCPDCGRRCPVNTRPRRLVAEARSYLGNNRDRMDYPRYRREWSPTTSSLVESLVGEFNARVKSKQKHWTRPGGAESILQLRAAFLSEDDQLSRHFADRAGNPFRTKRRTNVETDGSGVQTVA